jgi:hypothetical protein
MTAPIGQSTQSVVDIFKRVYGDLNNLVPDTNYLAQNIPFAEGMKDGTLVIRLLHNNPCNTRQAPP